MIPPRQESDRVVRWNEAIVLKPIWCPLAPTAAILPPRRSDRLNVLRCIKPKSIEGLRLVYNSILQRLGSRRIGRGFCPFGSLRVGRNNAVLGFASGARGAGAGTAFAFLVVRLPE